MAASPRTPVALDEQSDGGPGMKTIHTSHGSFATGAEIADAVTEYALALARARMLDVVDIPFVTDDGTVKRVQIRIGWLIDTVVTSDELPGNDLIEVDTILSILSRTHALKVLRAPALSGQRVGHYASYDVNWDEVI